MGTRSKPIRYFDRVHPAVICTGMVCVLLGWLGVLAATLGALYLHLDPEPILKYFGPAAVLVALAGLANQAGVAALKSQLGRIERNTGVPTDETPVPAQRGYDRSDLSAFHTQPGSYR